MEHALLRPHKSSNYPQTQVKPGPSTPTPTGSFTIEHLLSVKVPSQHKSDSPQFSSPSTSSLASSLKRHSYSVTSSSLLNLSGHNNHKGSHHHPTSAVATPATPATRRYSLFPPSNNNSVVFSPNSKEEMRRRSPGKSVSPTRKSMEGSVGVATITDNAAAASKDISKRGALDPADPSDTADIAANFSLKSSQLLPVDETSQTSTLPNTNGLNNNLNSTLNKSVDNNNNWDSNQGTLDTALNTTLLAPMTLNKIVEKNPDPVLTDDHSDDIKNAAVANDKINTGNNVNFSPASSSLQLSTPSRNSFTSSNSQDFVMIAPKLSLEVPIIGGTSDRNDVTTSPAKGMSTSMSESRAGSSTTISPNDFTSDNSAVTEASHVSSMSSTSPTPPVSNLTGLLHRPSVQPTLNASTTSPMESQGPYFNNQTELAASMIFERSVQEIHANDGTNKIPLHHSSDDFIPPVLDASTEALTWNLNPEDVEVRSLRQPSSIRTFSFSDNSMHGHAPSFSGFNTLNANSIDYALNEPTLASYRSISRKQSFASASSELAISPVTGMPNPPFASTSPSGSAANPGYSPPGVNLKRASVSNMRRKKDGRVLSFCSFADLVNSENAAASIPFSSTGVTSLTAPASTDNSAVTSPTSGTQEGTGSPTQLKLSTSPTRSHDSSASIYNAYSFSQFTDNRRLRKSSSRFSLAQSDAGDFEPSLDISSLGETLRRNINVISSHS